LAQALAITPHAVPGGYFRIGPYLGTPEDLARFDRADQAHKKVLDWVPQASAVPLYLTGDSGSGKSSLLNAFVLPSLRARQWTIAEARVYQDPESALRDALAKLPGRRRREGELAKLRDLIEAAAQRAADRLLLVLDQFEEFVILAEPKTKNAFSALLADLQADPVEGLRLLLVLRSDYQTALEEIGLPPLRQQEN
ncbi:MAG: AAA family ATPase, partial [Gammaproteobacteria bacterium]